MKNKIILKKYLMVIILISICFAGIFSLINWYEYHKYTKNFNDKIGAIIEMVQEKYPNLSKSEIMSILNKDTYNSPRFLEECGIDVENESIVMSNDEAFKRFLIYEVGILLVNIILFIIVLLRYIKHMDKDISGITKCIKKINKKDYEIDIDSMTEDELSILKNELYKTTIMLKEEAESSNDDKINLKKSLEDISHQLKTPITSILVVLDSFIDEPDMDVEIRNNFILAMKREVVNISFLVQSLLKLSKFDANTITFIRRHTYAEKIVEESIKNVSSICDLRDITVECYGSGTEKLYCDYKWQVEAITNILKNCIEHSKDGQKVIIEFEQGKAYSMIKIKDFGEGISGKDIRHIFERFYKGENSSPDSVGIGLALSKTIIESDNGQVNVDSDSTGTTFTVKYYNLR